MDDYIFSDYILNNNPTSFILEKVKVFACENIYLCELRGKIGKRDECRLRP